MQRLIINKEPAKLSKVRAKKGKNKVFIPTILTMVVLWFLYWSLQVPINLARNPNLIITITKDSWWLISNYWVIILVLTALIFVLVSHAISIDKNLNKVLWVSILLTVNYLIIQFLSVCNVSSIFQKMSVLLMTSMITLSKILNKQKNYSHEENIKQRIKTNYINIFPSFLISCFITRLMISPIVETDSLLYHSGLANKWSQTWPSFPSDFGPGIGSEISFSYPNLLSGSALLISKITGLNVNAAIKIVVILSILLSTVIFSKINQGIGIWFYIAFLTLPIISFSYSWYQGYSLTATFSFMATYFYLQKNRKGTLTSLSILCLTTIPGLIFGFMLIGIYMLIEKRKFHNKILDLFFYTSPIMVFVLTQYLRSGSLLYPFIVWPRKESQQFVDLLSQTSSAVVLNGWYNLGIDEQNYSKLLGIIRYLLIPISFPGGLITLILFSIILIKFKNIHQKRLLIVFLLVPLLFYVLHLYWIRYQIPFIAVCFLLLSVELIKRFENFDFTHPEKRIVIQFTICSVIAISFIQLVTGSFSSTKPALLGYQNVYSQVSTGLNIKTQEKYALVSEYGTRVEAWEAIKKLRANGNLVGVFDDVGQIITNSSEREILDGIGQTMIMNKLSTVFVAGYYIDNPSIAPQYFSSEYLKPNSKQFQPCASWPGVDVDQRPNVMWTNSSETICKDSYKVFHQGFTSHIDSLEKLPSIDTKQPESFLFSIVVPLDTEIKIEYSGKIYKNKSRDSEKRMILDTGYRVIRFQGQKLNIQEKYSSLMSQCEKKCTFSIPAREYTSVVQVSIDGMQKLKNLKIYKYGK